MMMRSALTPAVATAGLLRHRAILPQCVANSSRSIPSDPPFDARRKDFAISGRFHHSTALVTISPAIFSLYVAIMIFDDGFLPSCQAAPPICIERCFQMPGRNVDNQIMISALEEAV